MEDLKILFIHPEETERDSFRRACLDEEFKVDTVANIEEAMPLTAEYKYEMIFVNRKLGGEEITSFVAEMKKKYPDAEYVIGVPSITKADILHYQNQQGFYHMYLEPINYRKDLLPMIQTFMLDAKARQQGEINQEAKDNEERWNEFQNLMVRLMPGKEDSLSHTYALNVLRHYHKMSMENIRFVSDMQNELIADYANHRELHIKWDVKENAKRVLEYVDAGPKLFVTRMMCMVALAEVTALAGGYNTEITIMLEGNKAGIHMTSQAIISGDHKETDEKSVIIIRETDGILDKFCSQQTKTDNSPAGIWMHNRDLVFDT